MTLDELIEQARQSHKSLTYLVQSTLAQGDAEDATADLDALLAPVALLERAGSFEIGELDGRSRRFKASGVVRHDKCGRAYADDKDAENLKALLSIVATHECPGDPEELTEPLKAAQDFQKAYRDAVGLNIFDTKTARVATTAQAYMIALARQERDKLSREYENTGIMQTPDLDALDRVVDLLEAHTLAQDVK